MKVLPQLFIIIDYLLKYQPKIDTSIFIEIYVYI